MSVNFFLLILPYINKQMKKTVILSILFLLVTTFYLNAQDRRQTRNNNAGRGNNSHGSGFGHSNKPTVGAPLDGGLLLVLGGAGVAYYAARKKKQNL